MSDQERDLDELRSLAHDAGIDADSPAVVLDAPPQGMWERIVTEVGHGDHDRASASSAGRRSWFLPATAAAVLVLVLMVAGVLLLVADERSDVVARATLDPIGSTGSGSAELVDADGSLQLRVDTTDVPAGDGFLEVWLIDPDVERLVSLGPLRSDGRYELPSGLDVEAFPIVDVSAEPIDGNPTHSGDSRLRGQLEF
jgi:hypothetical protein